MQTTDYGIIILAAGSSSRLGKAKQLLPYGNKTLLQHTINEALAVTSISVVVVGANESDITLSIQSSSVQIVSNKDWQEGMGSSIKCGLSALLNGNPDLASAIILLCDQPFVSAHLLQELIETQQATGKEMVACVYNDTLGVPALFTSSCFASLLAMTNAEGAKKLLTTNKEGGATIPFPSGAVDIDTMQDYEQFINNQHLE